MATDLTTLAETLRTIDGTENVRLATSGANWRAPLATIFSTLGRTKLTADTTFYIRPDGSDSNNGLTNSSGGAFQTLGKGLQYASQIDFNGYTCYLQLTGPSPPTTFSIPGLLIPVCVGQADIASLVIVGDATTPSNVVIQPAANQSYLFILNKNARCGFSGLKLQNGGGFTSDNHIYNNGGAVTCIGKMEYGAAGNAHITVDLGGLHTFSADYTISGGATFHVSSSNNAMIRYLGAQTVTTSGTPAFSGRTYDCYNGSISVPSYWVTFAGTGATGTRYVSDTYGIINSAGGGATFLPGNVAGALFNGGLYT